MRINIKGSDIAFDCDSNENLLRAALRAGYGFPYECNSGACGTCRFQLIEGEIEKNLDSSPSLGEKDFARERYLGCQATPNSDCTIKLRLDEQYQSLHKPEKFTATLNNTRDLTHDLREFTFTASKPFAFLPGQYALVSQPGSKIQRAYSMSNLPNNEAEISFQIKRVAEGYFTDVLFNQLKNGDTLEIDGPYGMAYFREDNPRDIICLAGGSGLAPMISIAHAAAYSTTPGPRNIHFFYGGRTPQDICGEDLLATLPGYGERIHYQAAISDAENVPEAEWQGKRGFLHDVVREQFGDALSEYEIYFAGPPLMGDAVQLMLYELKMPPAQVHFDRFY